MSTNVERMDDRTFYFYAHPLRRRRFYLALVFATLLLPLIALALLLGTVFLIVPVLALLFWISARVLFANLVGNMVLVSKLNYPRIDALTEELKQRLGYDKRVYVFVYESEQFNTYLRHLFFRRAIFLNSEILDEGVSDDEIRWLVGRFVGYLRARKQAGVLGWLIRAAQYLLVFNLFLLPYERAMVFTGDRLAVAAIGGDIASAISAMQKLFVGRQLGYSLNPEGIIEQQREIKGSFFAFLARLPSSHPLLTMRYVDLIAFAKAYFPSRYARFAAANPGIPEDLPRLAATSEQVAPALDEHTSVKSGRGAGWATSLATLGVLALVIAVVWPRSEPALDYDFADTAPLSPDAVDSSEAPREALFDSRLAEPADDEEDFSDEPGYTAVAMDPERPIAFDDFYPEESIRRSEQGVCVVEVTVLEDGSIIEPFINTSSGYPRLDAACLESLRGQHLIPATENGAPIVETALFPIEWRLVNE